MNHSAREPNRTIYKIIILCVILCIVSGMSRRAMAEVDREEYLMDSETVIPLHRVGPFLCVVASVAPLS